MDRKRFICQVFLSGMVIVGLFTALAGKRISSFAGPYDIAIRRVESAAHNLKMDGKLFCTPYKRGQLQYVWGFVNQTVPITDDDKVDVNIAIWSNNQWKRNAFVMKFDRPCSNALRHARNLIIALGNKPRCPFPARYTVIENKTFELNFPEFKVFPYGRYLFLLNMHHNNELSGILMAEADVIPKL